MQRTTKKAIFVLYVVSFLFFHSITHGHGFGSNTPIQLGSGSWQTIHTICLRALHDTISVASYDIHTFCNANQYVITGRRSKSNCYIRLGFDVGFNDTSHDDIICTPMQEFYIPATHQWIPAYLLKPGDALLTKNMIAKPITYKKFVPQPLRIYTLEIQESHAFFVGKYSILTHNIILPIAASLGFTIPFGSVATGAVGSFFGPIGLMGGVVLGGIISIAAKAIYENRILSYKTPVYNIASIKAYCHHKEINSTIKPTGCFIPDHAANTTYIHVTPIENPLPQTAIGCIQIGVMQENQVAKGCNKNNELEKTNSNGCFQPAEYNNQPLFNTQDKASVTENNKIRYQGPYVRNWKEFEENCLIGQQYGKKFINTGKQNPKDGAPIRQLSEDIPKTEMFKKGYQFAPDRLHGDHFEVWDKNGKWIGVANLDGSKNYTKSNAEKNQPKRKLND
ncbi:MAG TPA: polymorphic toxin-type HINT domain-containing protein [Candidatus Babeliales bacterium]|nr:polymorphic toxin-type HINT domain-containing protein [Candidatus Babeliales bacterium]